MSDDPFDLDRLTLTPGQIANLAPLQKQPSLTKLRKRNGNASFVMLPYEQTLAAAGRLENPILAVLVELTYRRFKTHKNPVPLTNEALAAVGVSRWAKNRALKRLEAAGLVKVTWRRRRTNPLVKILY